MIFFNFVSLTLLIAVPMVDGQWGDWGSFGECVESKKTRQRECNNPVPSGGGATCNGDASETADCGIPADRLGCFVYTSKRPVLPHLHQNEKKASLDYCLKYCKDLDYDFAGMRQGNTCACGNDKPRFPLWEGAQQPNQCNTECSGDADQLCGAESRLVAYEIKTREFQQNDYY